MNGFIFMTCGEDLPHSAGHNRVLSILLWIAVSTGLTVSIFTVVEELCLATACRDTASFTFFGVNMGWLGITYFSLILILLWRRKSVYFLNWVLAAMVFAGIGAEFRLLWIQKFVIGSWCPLCVTICCALFVAAMLLLVEKIRRGGTLQQDRGKNLLVWIAFVVTMVVTGLVVSIFGVQAIT